MALLKNCEIYYLKADPKRPNAAFNKENPTWEVQIRTSNPEQKAEWESLGLKPKLIVGKEGEFIKVKVNSPPVGGEANKELISLISKRLSIPRGSIEIISGKTSRIKLLRLRGIDKESVVGLMEAD